MCGKLAPLPHRLRLDEPRGVGPWEDSYFKRKPTLEEMRQDLAEQQALCDKIVQQGQRLAQEHAERVAVARRAAMAAVADKPIPEIEQLLDKVKRDDHARRRVIEIIDGLDCDDPRKARYRTQLASRLL